MKTLHAPIIILSIFLMIGIIVGTQSKEKTKRVPRLGTKIVMYSDTLMIVDYSLLNENYTLSNNTKVSFELVEALPVIN